MVEMISTPPRVKLEKFEGPLDLLLELIEREELAITDVSLAKVADQYLVYIEASHIIDPSNLANFLYIAAQLLLIKSKALLPQLDLSGEESLSADELAFRLQEYKKFRDASRMLARMYLSRSRAFEQRFFLKRERVFYPGENVNRDTLLAAFHEFIQVLKEQKVLTEETVRETISIRDTIAHIHTVISAKAQSSFRELLASSKDTTETVVTFLAILELIKQKMVRVSQDERFGDIMLYEYGGGEEGNDDLKK